LTPVLEKVFEADALVVGTPVYFGAETGECRSFLERLLFPFVTYTPNYASIFPRKIPTAILYTMNVREQDIERYNYDKGFNRTRVVMGRVFGRCEAFYATDTLQFDDYAKYLSTVWDAEAKAKRREEVFPQDCARAFALGETPGHAGLRRGLRRPGRGVAPPWTYPTRALPWTCWGESFPPDPLSWFY